MANYRIGRNSGTLQTNRAVYDGRYTGAGFSLGGQFSSWVTVRNLAYNKQVDIVYTTDNWATTRVAAASFHPDFWLFAPTGERSHAPNPGLNGCEEWNYTLTVGAASRVEYAIRYRVNVNGQSQVYWDNNFGNNYVVNLNSQ